MLWFHLDSFLPTGIKAVYTAWGDSSVHSDQPSAADSPFEVAEEVDEANLARVMQVVPLGAGVLAGTAVALLVLGYLLIYLLVFLPRGTVG
jgi:hypothetical protein